MERCVVLVFAVVETGATVQVSEAEWRLLLQDPDGEFSLTEECKQIVDLIDSRCRLYTGSKSSPFRSSLTHSSWGNDKMASDLRGIQGFLKKIDQVCRFRCGSLVTS